MNIQRQSQQPKLPEAVVAKLKPLAELIVADYSANPKARDAFLAGSSKIKWAIACNIPTSKGPLSSYLANKPLLIGAVIGMVIVDLRAKLASTGTVVEVEDFDFDAIDLGGAQ